MDGMGGGWDNPTADAHLLNAIQGAHVVQRVQRRRQAAVQAEYLRHTHTRHGSAGGSLGSCAC